MPTWSTPPDFTAGNVVTEEEMDTLSNDLTYLLNRPAFYILRDAGSSYTTTSTAFANVDTTNLSGTMAMAGGRALIGVAASGTLSNTGYMTLDISVDGTRLGNAGTDGIYALNYAGAPATPGPVSFVVMVSGLSAASHTFKLMWRVNSGAITGTLYSGNGSAGSDFLINFYGVEVG